MQHLGLSLPIRPGKTEALEEFVRTITDSRWSEYDEFQQRYGVRKVVWFLQRSARGDQFVIDNEGADFAKLSSDFAKSTHPFDLWFTQRTLEITGIDVSTFDPSMLPEVLLEYGD